MSITKTTLLRPIIAIVIVLLVAFGGYRYWVSHNSDQGELVLYGNVDMREVEVAFVLQERITHLYAEEGDQVKQGQLLAKLDPVRFEQAVAKSKAELAIAKANVRDARVTYERIKGLYAKKLASPQDVDDAQAKLDAAAAQVQGATAALARTEKDLTDTKLLAPANGVIKTRILEVGDIAGPQKPVFSLALLEPLWIRAYVSETELGRIWHGIKANVSTDSFPDKIYAGHIGYISPTAEFTPKTVQTNDVRSSLVYQVRVLVPDPQNELRIGMPVTVTIPQQDKPLSDPEKGTTDASE